MSLLISLPYITNRQRRLNVILRTDEKNLIKKAVKQFKVDKTFETYRYIYFKSNNKCR